MRSDNELTPSREHRTFFVQFLDSINVPQGCSPLV